MVKNKESVAEPERAKPAAAAAAAAVIEGMMDAVVITDLEGKIIQFNKALTDNFGYGEEVIGELPTIWVAERDIPKVMDGIGEVFEKGYIRNFECTGITKDKRELSILLNTTLMKDAEGNPTGIIAVVRDITELKRAQEKEKEAVAAAAAAAAADKARLEETEKSRKSIEERAKKLEDSRSAMIYILEDVDKAYKELKVLDTAKSDFIAIASHELKTPLAIIRGYCDLLYDGTLGKIDAVQKEKIGNIVEETDRLMKLVKDILDLSAIEAGKLPMKKEKILLSDLMKDVVSEFKPLTDTRKQKLIMNIPEKLPFVMGDKNRVSTVFHNLIDNAVKYAPDNGTITVGADNEGSYLHFTVSDNGPGIPSESMEKIFDRFYSAESHLTRKGSGMGLGLSICKGIIEAHNGKIWAESKKGRGSIFHVLLPKQKEV